MELTITSLHLLNHFKTTWQRVALNGQSSVHPDQVTQWLSNFAPEIKTKLKI